MIINHGRRFIFLHVPKTAGTSVTSWLSTFTGWNDIELGGTHYGEEIQAIYGRRFKLHKHSPAAEISRIVGDEIWSAYFKFAVVRDPFDRLVSAYQFYREWDHPGVAAVKEMAGFDEFLDSDYFACDLKNTTRPTGLQSRFLGVGESFEPDFVCRFESVERDIAEVAARIGAPTPKLPRINTSKRTETAGYYTPRTRALVADLYAADFSAFGYDPS